MYSKAIAHDNRSLFISLSARDLNHRRYPRAHLSRHTKSSKSTGCWVAFTTSANNHASLVQYQIDCQPKNYMYRTCKYINKFYFFLLCPIASDQYSSTSGICLLFESTEHRRRRNCVLYLYKRFPGEDLTSMLITSHRARRSNIRWPPATPAFYL
jgi:hypothetical protein